jgi:exosome complex exonuclease DIS3/RRP44
MLEHCLMATSKQVSVSITSSTCKLHNLLKALSIRHRRCLILCASRQSDGRRSRVSRYYSIPRGQTYRYASFASWNKFVLSTALCGKASLLSDLGTYLSLARLTSQAHRLPFQELDQDANIVNVRFTKSVIASKEAFTYEAAQKRKDNKSLTDPLTESVRMLNALAIKLKAKRMAAGALNLASPEVKIHLDSSETTGPIDVEQKEMLETNSLVEEFMLLANISVAQKIFDTFPQTAVLRRHLPPPATNFEVLADVLQKRKGLELDVSSSGALAASLDRCIDSNLPAFNTLVRIMATRCMLSAEYFCSGSVPRDTFGHYGLASPIYTHFTSPIRRYADVLVHRQLNAAINHVSLHATLHSKAFVDRVMENINKRHRSAQHAGRASVEFYVALALQDKEKASIASGQGKIREEAFVIRAFRNGLAVFVSR